MYVLSLGRNATKYWRTEGKKKTTTIGCGQIDENVRSSCMGERTEVIDKRSENGGDL